MCYHPGKQNTSCLEGLLPKKKYLGPPNHLLYACNIAVKQLVDGRFGHGCFGLGHFSLGCSGLGCFGQAVFQGWMFRTKIFL